MRLRPLRAPIFLRPLLLLVALLAGFGPTSAAAQGGTAQEQATALALDEGTEVELDGHLAESFWARVPAIDDFRTREPAEGGMPSERTEVRIAWDSEALYVGVTAFDGEPDQVVARIRQRDQLMTGGFRGVQFQGDDGVALLLDPFDDDRNGIVLATNANGAMFDALLVDEGAQTNIDWQGVWEVAGARTPDGWSAEFRIPWRSIRYPAGVDSAWGLNVLRSIPRRQEQILWRSWQREGGGFERVARAGRLAGMSGLPSTGSNLEVKPFVLAGSRGELGDAEGLDWQGEYDVGLDLKTELRSGLVLDLTVNTDFAQVEVDDQQVNLTRFSLFFPEKRDFFLENAGIFDFGRRGFRGPPPFLMFFSRRVGIGNGEPVPILGGARMTGRVGDQTVGFLSVATDAVEGLDREFFNVARVKRDVGESGFLGAMVTDRRGDGPANTVIGFDGRWLPFPTLITEGFLARSLTEGEGGEGTVWGANSNFTTDLWGGFLQLLSVDEGTTSRAGFVARTDFRAAQLNLRRSFRPDALGVRKIDLRVNNEWGWTQAGRFQEREWGPSLRVEFESGADLNLNLSRGESQIDRAFVLADSLPVPAGRYSVDDWSIRAGTSPARPWRLSGSLRKGDFHDGRITAWSAEASWAPSPALLFAPSFNRSRVELPSGDFTADVTALRATWAYSPRLTTTASVQYNGLSRQVVTNVRLNFIHRPGSDLFLVFSDERLELEDRIWRSQDRGLLMKLTWLIRV